MAATDSQIVVAAARWADEGSYLREFVTKQRLPAVVKIVKGQYGGLGVPTLPCPGLHSSALLVSAGRRHKIVAQPVKIKDGRRLIAVGPRLAIPDTYQGYFELLSEEGRAVRCMESVSELSRRRPEDGCLVREPIRAISARLDPQGTVVGSEGPRTVASGEILVPSGEICLPSQGITSGTTNFCSGRFLRCRNSKGENVLLPLEQRGRFSALAREDNISGVHTAKNLLTKRMPMTVRLVHGQSPKGLKSPAHFVPELRLLCMYEEEHVFALPLHRDAQSTVPLPLAAPLKLMRAKNHDQLKALPHFQRLVERCTRLAADAADRIHVLDGKLSNSSSKRHLHGSLGALPPASGPTTPQGYALRRSTSTDSAGRRARHYNHQENKIPAPPSEYDEIDQIYDYVRGFAPLPKSARSPFEPPASPQPAETAPEPPPIETIPTKKVQAEKRNRKNGDGVVQTPGLPKLYIKNGQSQKSRVLLRQKSASPLKETPPNAPKLGSPLFNIRYKSLSNLQQAMELDGTLDSSHSGGRASGDSAAGAKQPEKRSRRLSRPRSLTNLVFEGNIPPVPTPDVILDKRRNNLASLLVAPNVQVPATGPGYKKALARYTVAASTAHKRAGTLYL